MGYLFFNESFISSETLINFNTKLIFLIGLLKAVFTQALTSSESLSKKFHNFKVKNVF